MWGKRLCAIIMSGLACLMYVIYAQTESSKGDGIQFVAGRRFYEKTVAITFDDGPRADCTKRLLDGLKERGIRATFFLVGENIPGNEDLVRQMKKDGHIIGNHTYTHVELSKLSHEAAMNEINKTNALIEDITGEKVVYIRPPCGAWSERMIFEVDMTPVFWNVDPKDWCTEDSATVVKRVVSNINDGDIILFHDIYDSSVSAALEVIDRLKAQGYVFVTIDEILIE